MAKFSTPGIYFTEIDNTIQQEATASLGTGAIVIKSNKGMVNQIVNKKNYSSFVNTYGNPEKLDDYGHFAAENYFENSDSLQVIRATMGDEQYSQIQYPYNDASDKKIDERQGIFEFVENDGENKLKIVEDINASYIANLKANDEWYSSPNSPTYNLHLNQTAKTAVIKDIFSNSENVIVFKNKSSGNIDDFVTENGVKVSYRSIVNNDGSVGFDPIDKNDLVFKKDSWAKGEIEKKDIKDLDRKIGSGDKTGHKISFYVGKEHTLNNKKIEVTFFATKEFKDSLTSDPNDTLYFNKILDFTKFYKNDDSKESDYINKNEDIKVVSLFDWNDLTNKSFTVEGKEVDKTLTNTSSISFKEYGYNTFQDVLALNSTKSISTEYNNNVVTVSIDNTITTYTQASTIQVIPFSSFYEDKKESATAIIDMYNLGVAEALKDKYYILRYVNVWNGSFANSEYTEKLIVKQSESDFVLNNDLFWVVKELGKDDIITLSTYKASKPKQFITPYISNEIDPIIAYPSSEVLNIEKYKDGYTTFTETEDDVGIGDVEDYISNRENQLIITALNPGEWGNDIGISIITTECEKIPSLNHQNAFNWKYRYDDEDQIDNFNVNQDNLIWKKVYRINVYVKPKTQTTESAWGTGMDALLKEPTESFFVSNDPTLKDSEGNSLFAPTVINGFSDYIYISRNSVNEAISSSGNYEQPAQTYSIYPLTGGKNSKKNLIREKTSALKLFDDRQKVSFDIIFNTEAIDSFSGQMFLSHQKRIADIAGNRKDCIAVVQTTSKESRTIKRQISESKMFTFNNPSYVAAYGEYDKYYNSTLASWIYLPKSIAGASAIAFCFKYSYPWKAPAGISNGSINYSRGKLTKLTDDEIGQLYDININTSRAMMGYGEVLWGQKTCLKKESALNRINVRCLLIFLKKELELMFVPFMFQNNTANTRSAAKNSLDAFLSRVKAAGGVETFSTSVTQDDLDPRILNINIKIVPAETIEFIDIKISIDRNTGVSVDVG